MVWCQKLPIGYGCDTISLKWVSYNIDRSYDTVRVWNSIYISFQ